MKTAVVVVVLVLAVVGSLALKAPPKEFRKQLAGPPEEFAQFIIPDPLVGALESTSALKPIEITESNGRWGWQGTVLVDSSTRFSINFFHPHEEYFSISASVGGVVVPAPLESTGPFGIDGGSFPVTSWIWNNPTMGQWQVQLISRVPIPAHERKAMLLLANQSPLRVYSHLNTYDLQEGQEVGILASLYDATANIAKEGERPTPLLLNPKALSAQMEVTLPDGKEVFVPMHDDGLHGDLLAGDGVYAASIQAFEVGEYTAQAIFEGTLPSGVAFYRTTEHLFPIIEPDMTLTGLAWAERNAAQRLILFHVDIDILHPVEYYAENGLTVKTYTEVWATSQANPMEYVPVAWLQAMVDPSTLSNGQQVLTLQMNEDWLNRAQATAPFQLRNVWIEDRDTNVPFSHRDSIFVRASEQAHQFKPNPARKDTPITREMMEGPRPVSFPKRNATATAPSLMLVHGYCAGSNEFSLSQFSNAVQFQDYRQSRSNDAFALKLNDFANQQGMTSFGVVGHSQAGLASTHLHTYYFSALENAQGQRLIQSVGSPYLGTPLAGTLAGIGPIFGFGCGKNTDLTTDGAARWAAAIPGSAKSNVYYYLTQYGSSGYCVFGANIVLALPNDGTTEQKRGQWAGTNNCGSKTNWCHTNGMTSPAQCTDPARNQEMNSLAAR